MSGKSNKPISTKLSSHQLKIQPFRILASFLSHRDWEYHVVERETKERKITDLRKIGTVQYVKQESKRFSFSFHSHVMHR